MENRVEFEYREVTWIRIRGQERPEAKESIFPMTRDDNGLVGEMYDFMVKEKILPLHTMSAGGGQYSGLLYANDAKKVIMWLKENGGSEL